MGARVCFASALVAAVAYGGLVGCWGECWLLPSHSGPCTPPASGGGMTWWWWPCQARGENNDGDDDVGEYDDGDDEVGDAGGDGCVLEEEAMGETKGGAEGLGKMSERALGKLMLAADRGDTTTPALARGLVTNEAPASDKNTSDAGGGGGGGGGGGEAVCRGDDADKSCACGGLAIRAHLPRRETHTLTSRRVGSAK